MPLNLHEAFGNVPGIYVIGAQNPRDVKGREVYWKVGMASSLRDRLREYSICFPEGYWIRLLLTLPTPQGRNWRGRTVIDAAVRKIEREIHSELDAEGSGAIRSTAVHRKGEWFKGRISSIYHAIVRVLFRLGLQSRVRVHDDLDDVKYGTGTGSVHIPEGDAPRLDDVVPSTEEARPTTDPLLRRIPKQPAQDREYEVQKILAKSGTGKSAEYLVKWRGWPKEWNLWVPASELKYARRRIEEFEQRARQKEKG